MNYLEFQEKIKLLNEELIKTNGNVVLLPKNIRSLGTELSEKNPEVVDEIGYLTKHDFTGRQINNLAPSFFMICAIKLTVVNDLSDNM